MTFFRIRVVMYLVGQGVNVKEVKVRSPTPLDDESGSHASKFMRKV